MPGRLRLSDGARSLALCLVLAASAAPSLRALVQQRTAAIVGRVVDHESHAPIRGARIAFLGAQRALASDSEGRFARDSLGAGSYVLQARALGYVGATWVLEVTDGEVVDRVFELERVPVQLDPVEVVRPPSFAAQRQEEFERRRAQGRGYFMTEGQIEATHPRTLSDLLRNVPGVRLVCRGASGCTARMARAPLECRPDFVLDGFPATYSTSLDMPTVGIIGIEVYRTLSETPLQFLKTDNMCGTIVIWTRSGPPENHD